MNLAEIAEHEVGVIEVGGNNCGPRIVEYQKATWLAPAAWPWCAAFVCWCIREWAFSLDLSDPVFGGKSISAWRPKTAGAYDFERWARKNEHPVLSKNVAVSPGNLIVFDFSHIGIAVRNAQAGSKFIDTVEGNTGPSGKRDSESGDGVWRKRRPRSVVRSIIRLERAA